MSDQNDPPPPPPSSPFPDSSLTPPPQEEPPTAPMPPSVPDPLAPAPPIPPAPPEPRPWMESPPAPPTPGPTPPAPDFPPGYTSPPPPGAAGGFPAPPAHSTAAAPAPGTYVLAGWWRRVGAAVIDGILIFGIGSILAFAVGTSLFSADQSGLTGMVVGLLTFVFFVGIGSLVYAPVMMGRTNGRTLGRMATGIRVVRADHQPITIGFAALREVAVKWLLVGIISALTIGLVWLVDVLWPLWDDENRALHDFVVNTRTVMDG